MKHKRAHQHWDNPIEFLMTCIGNLIFNLFSTTWIYNILKLCLGFAVGLGLIFKLFLKKINNII
jgi:hypothetical protein